MEDKKTKSNYNNYNLNKKEKHHRHHIMPHHINGLLIIVIILSILLLVMIKPSFENYMNNKRFNDYGSNPKEIIQSLKDMEQNLALTESNYSSCLKTNKIYKKENNALKSNLSDIETENSRISSNLDLAEKRCENKIEEFNNSIQNEIKTYEMEAKQSEARKEQVEENFKELAENSAKNICCKQKVDNPEINSYSIINNKIVCEENEDKVLKC